MAKNKRGRRSPDRSATTTPSSTSARRTPTEASSAAAGPSVSRNLLLGLGALIAVLVIGTVVVVGGLGGDQGTATATPAPASPVAASPGVLPPVALERDTDPLEAAQRWEDGAILLDVREDVELAAGRVPGAQHIPLGELAARAGELPTGRPILVICRSGNRSQEGRDILIAAGFPQVTSVNGGVRAWRDAGLPYQGEIA